LSQKLENELVLKAALETGAAGLTLAGVFVGVYGTYKMTKFYHPYRWAGFVKSVVMTMYRDLTGQEDKVNRHNRVAAKLAGMTPEDKADSLRGVEWVFVGFLLQTGGAIIVLIDVIVNA
jgi:hypothetical protein